MTEGGGNTVADIALIGTVLTEFDNGFEEERIVGVLKNPALDTPLEDVYRKRTAKRHIEIDMPPILNSVLRLSRCSLRSHSPYLAR